VRPPPMPLRSPITVAIAHFEDLLALGLRTLLAGDSNVSVIAHDIAHERIPAVLRAHRPRVLILDVGALRDLAQVRELSVQHPHTRLVLLGDGLLATEAAQVLAFGASAVLGKDTQARDVQHAIHLASRGMQVMPRGTHDAGTAHEHEHLTHREADVLNLLRQDRSNAQVALELQIGIETVRTHARNIYRKLGVSSRRALIALPTPATKPPIRAVAHPARRRIRPRLADRRHLS
jgi:DNA-binding NarL/FixJ family response regulator